MGALSDTMLATGAALHCEAVHGETVRMVSGPDAGKTFTAIKENSQDIVLDEAIGTDHRGKRILRFRDGTPQPRINDNDIVQTADGNKWHATKAPQDGYLTTDYELAQIIPGKDQQ